MRQDRKIAYLEKELSRLRDDLKGYQTENLILTRELENKQKDLDAADAAYRRLEESYEKYMFSYSEHVEKLEEARIAYEEGLARVKKIMRDYKAEAEKKIASIQYKGKVV